MRFGLRSLARSPGFTALAVACFATGIGLMGALASVADAILFRPLPVATPAEIVRIYTSSPGQPLGFVSYPDFEDLRRSLGRRLRRMSRSSAFIGGLHSNSNQPPSPNQDKTLIGLTAQTQVLLAV